MENAREGFKTEPKRRRIEEVAVDAKIALQEELKKVKKEKVDKTIYPVDRALAILQFGSRLMSIPPVNEFIQRTMSKETRADEGVTLVSGDVGLVNFNHPVAAIFPDKGIYLHPESYCLDDSNALLSLSNWLEKRWESGTSKGKYGAGNRKWEVEKLSKLSKADVVKKFQKRIKV